MNELRNPKDPLHAQADAGKELFERFAKAANGFPAELAITAALNILINAVRQANPSQQKALAAFDEAVARTRGVLAEHYGTTGERRNIFPFHQVMQMEHFNARQTF